MDIAPELQEEIIAHAREDAPNECCGLIAVLPASEDKPARAMRVQRAKNVYNSPKRFEIDGKDAVKALLEFEDAGWQIGGIYHSHTHTAPVPSQTDINFSGEWPGVEWIIVGLVDPSAPEIRSYLIEKGAVREVEIEQVAV